MKKELYRDLHLQLNHDIRQIDEKIDTYLSTINVNAFTDEGCKSLLKELTDMHKQKREIEKMLDELEKAFPEY